MFRPVAPPNPPATVSARKPLSLGRQELATYVAPPESGSPTNSARAPRRPAGWHLLPWRRGPRRRSSARFQSRPNQTRASSTLLLRSHLGSQLDAGWFFSALSPPLVDQLAVLVSGSIAGRIPLGEWNEPSYGGGGGAGPCGDLYFSHQSPAGSQKHKPKRQTLWFAGNFSLMEVMEATAAFSRWDSMEPSTGSGCDPNTRGKAGAGNSLKSVPEVFSTTLRTFIATVTRAFPRIEPYRESDAAETSVARLPSFCLARLQLFVSHPCWPVSLFDIALKKLGLKKTDGLLSQYPVA